MIAASRAFKNILVAVKRFGEHENDCHHLCTAIIIGAGTLARSLSPISMKCRCASSTKNLELDTFFLTIQFRNGH